LSKGLKKEDHFFSSGVKFLRSKKSTISSGNLSIFRTDRGWFGAVYHRVLRSSETEVWVERNRISFFENLGIWFFQELEILEGWKLYRGQYRVCSILYSDKGLLEALGGEFWVFKKSTKIQIFFLFFWPYEMYLVDLGCLY
jgi:hypothetical protein